MFTKIEQLFELRLTKISLIALTLLGYFYYSFGNYDILPSDEDVYLSDGLNMMLPAEKFKNLLYPLGFHLFSKIFNDTITLLYVYNFVLSSLLFLSLIYFLNTYTQRFWLSFFLSVCFLFSKFQVFLQPRITIMNLIFGLFFLALLYKLKQNYKKWGILSLCLLLCHYVARPEFLWFFVISFLIFLYTLITNKELLNQKKAILVLLFGILIGSLYYLGGGINEPSKLKIAFIQHFFDNYFIWTGKEFGYYDEFVQFDKIYGKVNTDLELITVNPRMFFKHVETNFINYFFVNIKILKATFYDLFLVYFKANTYIFGAALYIIPLLFIDIKKSFKNLKTSITSIGNNWIFIIIFMIPTFVSTLVIYPRNHYCILHLPFYFLIIALILKSLVFNKNKKTIVISYILIFTFSIFLLFPLPQKSKISHVGFYRFILEKSKNKSMNVLANDIFGFSYYGKYLKRTGWDAQKDDLVSLANSGKYDIITIFYLDAEVPLTRKFIDSGYKNTNLVRINKFEKVGRYIYVKPELKNYFEN